MSFYLQIPQPEQWNCCLSSSSYSLQSKQKYWPNLVAHFSHSAFTPCNTPVKLSQTSKLRTDCELVTKRSGLPVCGRRWSTPPSSRRPGAGCGPAPRRGRTGTGTARHSTASATQNRQINLLNRMLYWHRRPTRPALGRPPLGMFGRWCQCTQAKFAAPGVLSYT